MKPMLVNPSLFEAQDFLDLNSLAEWTAGALSKAQPTLGSPTSATRLKAVNRLNGLISDSQRTRGSCEVDSISIISDDLTLFGQSFIDFWPVQQTTLLDRSAMQFEDYRSHDLRDAGLKLSRSKANEAKYKAVIGQGTRDICKSEANETTKTSEVYDQAAIEIGRLRADISKVKIDRGYSAGKDQLVDSGEDKLQEEQLGKGGCLKQIETDLTREQRRLQRISRKLFAVPSDNQSAKSGGLQLQRAGIGVQRARELARSSTAKTQLTNAKAIRVIEETQRQNLHFIASMPKLAASASTSKLPTSLSSRHSDLSSFPLESPKDTNKKAQRGNVE